MSRFVTKSVERFDLDDARIKALSAAIEGIDARLAEAATPALEERRSSLLAELAELRAKVAATGADWVDLLNRLSYGDRGAIEEKLLADAIKITDGPASSSPEPDVHARLHAGNLELLKRAVVAWGGPGFCMRGDHPHDGACAPAPIVEETLDRLDETGERILEELQRRLVKPSKDFSTTPSQPSLMADQAAPTAGA